MINHSALAKKFDRSVSMLAWGYNEEQLIEDFLDRAFILMNEVVEDFEVIFVNDGSSDRTGEIVDAYALREPRLRVIHNERNLNVGISCRRAIAAASKDYLFWQCVDWSYDLKNIRVFLELLKHYDVVQGIRPTPIRIFSSIPVIRSLYRVNSRSDNIKKAIVSLSNYYILRILFGINFHDFQNTTFYPTQTVQALDLVGVSSFINPELLIKTHLTGARFIEVPIQFMRRQSGEAKGTRLSSIVRSLKDIAINWMRWGWRCRLDVKMGGRAQIQRVAIPHQLDDTVLAIALPLLKEFR